RASRVSRAARLGDAPAPRGAAVSTPASPATRRGGERVRGGAAARGRARRIVLIDVSVVVVSYNDEADLPVSLASALAQTGVAVEVVLADNASSDRSAEIGRRLGARVLALPRNVGFAAAMNAGIESTTG